MEEFNEILDIRLVNLMLTMAYKSNDLKSQKGYLRLPNEEFDKINNIILSNGGTYYIANYEFLAIQSIEPVEDIIMINILPAIDDDKNTEKEFYGWILRDIDQSEPLNPVMINITAKGFTYAVYEKQSKKMTFENDFEMAKYQTTNLQYERFIIDDGYDKKKYWTEDGWLWRKENNIEMPGNWHDIIFRDPRQPVVGVSWYEAVAFCNWLSDQHGYELPYSKEGLIKNINAPGFRLPLEVEWEYVGRLGHPDAKPRVYAYGDEFDENKIVNSKDRPEPVGSRSKAGGDTPQGLCDMSGNAWEWCSDEY